MKFKLFFVFLISLIAAPISAHFIAGSIWYKDDAQGKRHWVYLLGDKHRIARSLTPEILKATDYFRSEPPKWRSL
jgi:hypothetical protein